MKSLIKIYTLIGIVFILSIHQIHAQLTSDSSDENKSFNNL